MVFEVVWFGDIGLLGYSLCAEVLTESPFESISDDGCDEPGRSLPTYHSCRMLRFFSVQVLRPVYLLDDCDTVRYAFSKASAASCDSTPTLSEAELRCKRPALNKVSHESRITGSFPTSRALQIFVQVGEQIAKASISCTFVGFRKDRDLPISNAPCHTAVV